MDNNFQQGDIVRIYCIDCDSLTRQKYKGVLADGSQLFLCEKCGCENTIEKYEQE